MMLPLDRVMKVCTTWRAIDISVWATLVGDANLSWGSLPPPRTAARLVRRGLVNMFPGGCWGLETRTGDFLPVAVLPSSCCSHPCFLVCSSPRWAIALLFLSSSTFLCLFRSSYSSLPFSLSAANFSSSCKLSLELFLKLHFLLLLSLLCSLQLLFLLASQILLLLAEEVGFLLAQHVFLLDQLLESLIYRCSVSVQHHVWSSAMLLMANCSRSIHPILYTCLASCMTHFHSNTTDGCYSNNRINWCRMTVECVVFHFTVGP